MDSNYPRFTVELKLLVFIHKQSNVWVVVTPTPSISGLFVESEATQSKAKSKQQKGINKQPLCSAPGKSLAWLKEKMLQVNFRLTFPVQLRPIPRNIHTQSSLFLMQTLASDVGRKQGPRTSLWNVKLCVGHSSQSQQSVLRCLFVSAKSYHDRNLYFLHRWKIITAAKILSASASPTAIGEG